MRKFRLDAILLEKKLVKDVREAFVMVTEGRVFVDGQKAIAPSQLVDPTATIEFRGGNEYVGRGALKLEAAVEKFNLNVEQKICADIGAAIGGFTEVLLKYNAKKVYAIDTARGKLDLKLRRDPRVVVMESTDIRDIPALPEPIDFVTIDVSLISLRQILPHVRFFLATGGVVIALFKPQYETRDPHDLRHGIIKDDTTRERLLKHFIQWLAENNWHIHDRMESPIKGGEGNTEFLFFLKQK